ncbi:hypothetical protein HFK18_12985|uniref:hypothetical protein n=1 Tax=Stenotrophomonas sp. SbOxS2 TaxID=2723885 RepID=UPI0015D4163C|nr:hypothetical protein [Stenotrophomonas sp. SbOxS2]NYT99396.1 hypothetical protein [Stenotrophomonas sp. SbOxS2]
MAVAHCPDRCCVPDQQHGGDVGPRASGGIVGTKTWADCQPALNMGCISRFGISEGSARDRVAIQLLRASMDYDRALPYLLGNPFH